MSEDRTIFIQKMRNAAAIRAGYKCSNPRCHRTTRITSRTTGKKINVGVAFMIYSDIEGDPRHDPSVTLEELNSVKNRVWLCKDCAEMIEADVIEYSAELLHTWRIDQERKTNQEVLSHLVGTSLLVPGKEDLVARAWEKPMFLEKKDGTGKLLKDLYIQLDYCVGDYKQSQEHRYHLIPRKDDMDEYLERIINDTTEEANPPLSLILGAPGAGKSCLFTYFLNREGVYRENGNYVYAAKRIFFYRFCDLTKDFVWKKDINGVQTEEQASVLLEQLLSVMEGHKDIQKPEEVLKNTILLLDGFDECAASEEQKTAIIKLMADTWGKYARIFITCRHEYIRNAGLLGNNISCISLQKMNENQILEFLEKYEDGQQEEKKKSLIEKVRRLLRSKKTFHGVPNEDENPESDMDEEEQNENSDFEENEDGSEDIEDEDTSDDIFSSESPSLVTDYFMEEELDVYGIPIIWYMILAMELEKEDIVVTGDVYSRIFSEKCGIYEKCLEEAILEAKSKPRVRIGISMNRAQEYSRYLIRVSREMALIVFSHNGNPDIKIRELEGILKNKKIEFKDDSGKVVPLYTALEIGISKYANIPSSINPESTIQFVHKSIYEYFMADYLASVVLTFYNEASKLDKEDLFAHFHMNISHLLCCGNLNKEICLYLEYKIEGYIRTKDLNIASSDHEQQKKHWKWLYSLFEEMLIFMMERGLTYYIQPDIKIKDIQFLEKLILTNQKRKSMTEDSDELEVIQKYINEKVQNWGYEVFIRKNLNREAYLEKEANIFGNLMVLAQLLRIMNHRRIMFKDNTRLRKLLPYYLGLRHYQGTNGGKFDLSGVNLKSMDFSHLNMSNYDFKYAYATMTRFVSADMRNSVFVGTDLERADFRSANLNYCEFTKANMRDVALTNANLVGVNPSIKKLMDDPEKNIPWTRLKGYIPDGTKDFDLKFDDYYPQKTYENLGKYVQERPLIEEDMRKKEEEQQQKNQKKQEEAWNRRSQKKGENPEGQENVENQQNKETEQNQERQEKTENQKEEKNQREQRSERKLEKHPIRWKILEIRGNRALIISDKILDLVPYNEEPGKISWGDSSIRKWLNSNEPGGFLYDTFTEKEQAKICRTLVEPDPHYQDLGEAIPDQGRSQIDKIFLLSSYEVYRYYAKTSPRPDEVMGSEYKVHTTLAVATMTGYAKSKKTSRAEEEKWWLRTVAGDGERAMYVNSHGQIIANGVEVSNKNTGIRPTMWVDLGEPFGNIPPLNKMKTETSKKKKTTNTKISKAAVIGAKPFNKKK